MRTFLLKAITKIVSLIIYFCAFFASQNLVAQVKFTSICPETTIGKNDVLQIQFKIENAKEVETIIPPSFKNFTVVSGPNQQSGMTNINGKIDQYVAISFYLKPNSPGTFTIGAAEAHVDGKKIFSNKVTVKVDNSNSPPSSNSLSNPSPFSNFNFDVPTRPNYQFDDYILKDGENPDQKIKKNLFVKLEVSKKSCYVGEPVTAAFKLYTRLRSESSITDAPSFNGFSVSDLEVSGDVDIEKYNGRRYNVYTLRKVQLYPMQEGAITLSPLVANNKVTFLKSEYANRQSGDRFFDMLDNFADATSPQNEVIDKSVILKSDPVVVDVKPLPAKNVPENFKGAVGNYTVSASLRKNTITTDDEGILQLVISGEGNIQMINAPKINWPDGVDGFDARVQETINKETVPMKGMKTFSYPFLVNQAGDFNIDSISFSFFNPATGNYKTLKTPPLSLHVNKGNGIIKSDLAKTKNMTRKNGDGFLQEYSTLLITGAALLMVVLLIFLIVNNKRQKKKAEMVIKNKIPADENIPSTPKENFIVPGNPLLPAHEKLIAEDSAGFYQVLDASLNKYLAMKFKIPAEEISRKRLNEELDRCNVGLSTSLMLNSLQEEIELNLYACPSGANQLKHVFEKASQVVSLLDKQVRN